jgi:hypothetical protein
MTFSQTGKLRAKKSPPRGGHGVSVNRFAKARDCPSEKPAFPGRYRRPIFYGRYASIDTAIHAIEQST